MSLPEYMRRACKAKRTYKKHGATKGGKMSRAYVVWCNMIARCTNPKNPSYKNYGGRGITVCDRWKRSFANFKSDMGEPPKGLSIDRINNDGNYDPSNCRWANAETQNSNTRRTRRRWNIDGKRMGIKAVARHFNVPQSSLRYRLIEKGETLEVAIAHLTGT